MSNPPSGYNTPKTNWQSADVVLPTDLNRIEGNINAIETGSRTIDPAQSPSGNSGSLRQWLDWFPNMIKKITGKTNWYDTPDTTLAAAKTHIDIASAHISGTSEDDVHNLLSEGRIIEETGSNTNGKYVKFANGLMICTRTVSFPFNNSSNPSATVTNNYNFPANFNVAPYGNVSGSSASTEYTSILCNLFVGTTTTQWTVVCPGGYISSAPTLYLVAIGWWE